MIALRRACEVTEGASVNIYTTVSQGTLLVLLMILEQYGDKEGYQQQHIKNNDDVTKGNRMAYEAAKLAAMQNIENNVVMIIQSFECPASLS